jgi:predicted acetyltransferase
VQEPRLLDAQAQDGTLLRIVDVAAALEARGYDADGRLRFGLVDDICPWNTATWALTVDGGCGRMQRTDAEPEVTLTPRTLAILASGQRPAAELARAGLIPPAEPRVLAAAGDLFATAYAPYTIEGF